MLLVTVLAIVALVMVFVVASYMRRPAFGSRAEGERLERMLQSPNYKGGRFHNQHFTPSLTEGYTMTGVMFEFLFKTKPGRRPTGIIPSVKTDLTKLSADDEILVWFGHASYFIQTGGKKFLIDPVFSGNASPVRGANKAFRGTDIYTVHDLPDIDYLLITHDHYDHLDHDTVAGVRHKTNKVICGLGVGAHLERWGFESSRITEMDWNESLDLDESMTIHSLPARHFSGRNFVRNKTLWLSLLLETASVKIYIGGDSGYDDHFKKIGERFGPIDMAVLDNGQYDDRWKYIHMHPQELLQAAKDLKAKSVLPFHNSKFAMANHTWKAPLDEITMLNKENEVNLLTPKIGEAVKLNDAGQTFSKWWQHLQ